MSTPPKAKYFCESCGNEVAADAKFCPKCGRFFSAVRCPQCGHVGTVKHFANGCPACHYTFTKDELYGKLSPRHSKNKKVLTKRPRHNKKRVIRLPEAPSVASIMEDVPAWLFVSSVAVLVLIFIVFLMRCKA